MLGNLVSTSRHKVENTAVLEVYLNYSQRLPLPLRFFSPSQSAHVSALPVSMKGFVYLCVLVCRGGVSGSHVIPCDRRGQKMDERGNQPSSSSDSGNEILFVLHALFLFAFITPLAALETKAEVE